MLQFYKRGITKVLTKSAVGKCGQNLERIWGSDKVRGNGSLSYRFAGAYISDFLISSGKPSPSPFPTCFASGEGKFFEVAGRGWRWGTTIKFSPILKFHHSPLAPPSSRKEGNISLQCLKNLIETKLLSIGMDVQKYIAHWWKFNFHTQKSSSPRINSRGGRIKVRGHI